MTTTAYWLTTLFVTLTGLAAGIVDLFHAQPFFGLLIHLGYPAYFGTLLGFWKVIGAVVLLMPGSPLMKEWAYAGMFCDYCSAVFSHAASHDSATALVGPLVSLALLAVSWSLRPPSRRLALR